MIKFEGLNNAAKITANIEKNVTKIEENMNNIFEYLKKYPNAKHKNIIEDLQISKRTLERMIALLGVTPVFVAFSPKYLTISIKSRLKQLTFRP